MVPPVKELGHLPDVTALIMPMETDVNSAQVGSREMVVRNVQGAYTEMIVVMTLFYISYR